MSEKYRGIIFFILITLLALSAAILMNPEFRPVALGALFAFILYLLPAFIGEEAFDFFDKFVDEVIEPQKKLSLAWHIVYSVIIAVIIGFVWAVISPLLVEYDGARLGGWLDYAQNLDETLLPHQLPAYSEGFAQHAIVATLFGYFFELVWHGTIWPAIKKTKLGQRLFSAPESDEA